MTLEMEGWKLEVDLTATMSYSAAEAAEHCTCAYCRNFYGAIDSVSPGLRPFLAQFGVDIEAPDELMPFAATNVMVLYAVSGRIREKGIHPLLQDGVRIDPEDPEEAMINTGCPTPYFVLSVGPLELPWVLDEPLEEDEVLSPANEPSFLRKMMYKLLKRTPKDPVKH